MLIFIFKTKMSDVLVLIDGRLLLCVWISLTSYNKKAIPYVIMCSSVVAVRVQFWHAMGGGACHVLLWVRKRARFTWLALLYLYVLNIFQKFQQCVWHNRGSVTTSPYEYQVFKNACVIHGVLEFIAQSDCDKPDSSQSPCIQCANTLLEIPITAS